MVQVRVDKPLTSSGELDVDAWIERLRDLSEIDDDGKKALALACEKVIEVEGLPGDKLTGWGEGYTTLNAGLDMAEILAELQLDAESLTAALLYRSVRENKISTEVVNELFGRGVHRLIDGVRQMAAISGLTNHSGEAVFGQESAEQAENVRKMLVAMVDDVRVALIKLAERTCAIRAVKKAPLEKRQRVAHEVADIYAPLAHRLGIGHIKWELEDLSFRYLRPYDYKYIAKLLDERRLDRQEYIENVIGIIKTQLSAEAIEADVFGRAKHIYSIWRKMRKKNIDFSQVYDIRAIRILVNTERECYTVLGIVHALWRNIPLEFDDYIANPKENGYRSLHTAVHGPGSRVLEVQIRTKAMHEEAEFGVCAHWRYKNAEKGGAEASYEGKIAWLRQVLEWHEEVGGSPWDDHLTASVEQDRIYLFTPEGHVIDLPEGATPVDFAFRIHSDVGLRCRGAKINGRIVPLNHPLKTADQVEILTGKRESPSRDWLNPALGYITTSRARARLHQWFKLQDRDQNIADGRALLDKEFKRLAVEGLDYDKLLKKLGLKHLDDLYAAVGTADYSVDKVLNAAQRLISGDEPVNPVISLVGKASVEKGGRDVFIDGVGNLMSQIAHCCHPIPGDRIVGYITLGRGVSIHRQDCGNIMQHQANEPSRIIAVDWAEAPKQLYSAVIALEAFDRHGLLRDITTLLDRERVNVSAMQTISDKDKNTVEMTITIEISDFGALSRVFAKLSQLPNVTEVRRKH
ncbi:GTP diphosphokinase [Saccharophagus degradans]|uniref:GTP diphosphokinase n=1 Tax=Saccharophagus degradans TaxID=86304 RepID=A0AAW7WZC9_9GAMM|nr:GTP diphosphokinase [Saccharophagus degradans]MBU2985912.1 GTP diphosphokinase [Saccharophagus degradans]MDO6420951.1 GTP diphosphokinase [Saccharophagus degradans]MDO6606138.1 GTP diphosphokinase [Saccharophagus degradans]